MVSENGIEADPDKVKALILLPSPKDTKQLGTFIQKVKYMPRFIPLSSQLLYPLQQVAKLDPLQWSNECEEVFQCIKEVSGSLPTMQAPNWDKEFHVNPSVGEDAIGAMLLQQGTNSHYMKPIYCASRVKLEVERDYTDVELIMVSVVYACRRKDIYGQAYSVMFTIGASLVKNVKAWWAEAKPVKQITSKDVAKFVYEDICCKLGMPLEFLSDKGPGFRGELVDYLCEKLHVHRRFTTPYYPQCNGMNERFNGKLIRMLTKMMQSNVKTWDLELPCALWAYRTAVGKQPN
ncbi:hypothetical protein L7F22_057401 [Adiantum nelumboides]|nr:hypothetical protein [Adiantum nelumboides]